MRPEDLKRMLEKFGLRPVHGRSQNFLLDDSVVGKMLEAAGIGPDSRVLEIGPGPGILTAALLAAGAQVLAVEIDSRFCRFLRRRFSGQPRLDLIEGDVLGMTNQEIAGRLRPPSGPVPAAPMPSAPASSEPSGGSPSRPAEKTNGRQTDSGAADWQVVSNLPYAITSATLEKFLFLEPRPKSLTLMIQREVADRILAQPNRMSSLAVACQSLAEPKRVVNVPRSSFFPPPEVDSAVIHIRLKNEAERRNFFQGIPEPDFFRLVRQAFSHKRKQIKNTLRGFSALNESQIKYLQLAKISTSSRPEELTPEQWVGLARVFSQSPK